MTKKILTLLLFGTSIVGSAQTNITNGNFETWTYDGDNLPNNWNSFQTASGQLASMGYSANNRQVKASDEVRPGAEGKSVVIWARSVLGVVAQGNLTSGRVNAGSTSATAETNYNWTDRTGSTTLNDVTNPCAMAFTGRPDSISVWVKFVPAKELPAAPYAKFSAIIHGDYDYISYGMDSYDTEENKAQVVASVVTNIENNGGQWERICLPFDYTKNQVEPAYIIVNLSTNATPGKGTKNDSLYVDDIVAIYNSRLAQAQYNKRKIAFDENNTAVIKGEYDANKLNLSSDGVSATIEETYDDKTALLTITVKGGDIEDNPENLHTYCIQFIKEEETKNPYATIEYPDDEQEAPAVDPLFFASRENPVDMTSLITNPGFEDGTNGWISTNNSNKALAVGGTDESHNAEFYMDKYSNGFFGLGASNTAFELKQTLNNIPNGIYKIAVQAFNRKGDFAELTGEEAIDALLYANENSTALKSILDDAQDEPCVWTEDNTQWECDRMTGDGKYVPNTQTSAALYFAKGIYQNEIEVMVNDGTLTFGIKKENNKVSYEWTLFDNFTLTYLGLTGEPAEANDATLNVTWPETLEANVIRETTTETIRVDFEYTDATPAMGWKYAYLELANADTTVLLGYCPLDATESKIEAQIPNTLESGEYNLVLRIGKSGLMQSTEFNLTVNEQAYTLTFVIDGETYLEEMVAIGEAIIYPEVEEREGYTFAWNEQIDQMPNENVTITGTYTKQEDTAIQSIGMDNKTIIHDLQGRRVQNARKGIYIINGKKVLL